MSEETTPYVAGPPTPPAGTGAAAEAGVLLSAERLAEMHSTLDREALWRNEAEETAACYVRDVTTLLAHAKALTARLTTETAAAAEAREWLKRADSDVTYLTDLQRKTEDQRDEFLIDLRQARAEATAATRELSYEQQMRQQTEEAMVTLAARVKEEQAAAAEANEALEAACRTALLEQSVWLTGARQLKAQLAEAEQEAADAKERMKQEQAQADEFQRQIFGMQRRELFLVKLVNEAKGTLSTFARPQMPLVKDIREMAHETYTALCQADDSPPAAPPAPGAEGKKGAGCIFEGCQNSAVHDGACACYVNGRAHGEEVAGC